MINEIKVVNSYGEELTMALIEPQFSGYAITEISGIGPTDVDIKQTQFVSGRKYKYNAGFHKYREITLNIIYYEDNIYRLRVEELRNNLYKYFATNDKIKLYFEKDNTQYAIEGYVSKHEPTFWSDACGVKIMVLCPDPWFRKIDTDYIDDTTSIFDNIDNSNKIDIIYNGDISSGLKLYMPIANDSYINNFHGQIIIETKHIITNEIRQMFLNISESYNYNGINYRLCVDLLSDNINVYIYDSQGNKIGCNGWIDSSSISKRQEIPEILPNQNQIKVYNEGNELKFKIEYNTLYRGL